MICRTLSGLWKTTSRNFHLNGHSSYNPCIPVLPLVIHVSPQIGNTRHPIAHVISMWT